MDIHCATCGEPWDTYHIRHDAVHETPAGLDWLNWKISMEEYAEVEVLQPPEPHAERWEGKLTPFWRDQFKQDGWEFGTSLMAVLRCPCCKDNDEMQNAAERRQNVQLLSDLLDGDEDGQASENHLALLVSALLE